VGVGGQASIHPPVPLSGLVGTRATTLGWKRSQHDGGRRTAADMGIRAPRRSGRDGADVRRIVRDQERGY
jgi:hypothetical protein